MRTEAECVRRGGSLIERLRHFRLAKFVGEASPVLYLGPSIRSSLPLCWIKLRNMSRGTKNNWCDLSRRETAG
jgi:hypothetical protein